ncbi:hypothetical protein COCCADRAFT_104553, partial [Bipolaris zeicola 26-R-13]
GRATGGTQVIVRGRAITWPAVDFTDYSNDGDGAVNGWEDFQLRPRACICGTEGMACTRSIRPLQCTASVPKRSPVDVDVLTDIDT